MKHTAVEWLMEIDKSRAITIEEWQQAKEMEKVQIIDTYDAGQLHFWPDEFLQRGEHYYNETFKTNER
jgi:hypothetical protein